MGLRGAVILVCRRMIGICGRPVGIMILILRMRGSRSGRRMALRRTIGMSFLRRRVTGHSGKSGHSQNDHPEFESRAHLRLILWFPSGL